MKRFVWRVLRNAAIACLVLFILQLALFVSSPIFIKPYTTDIEYQGERVSFMPYTSKIWTIKMGKEGIALLTPSRSDPINVIFFGVSRKELQKVFHSFCWKEKNRLLNIFSFQRLYNGWAGSSPTLEFRYIYDSQIGHRYHIRIFNVGKIHGESVFVGAVHEEYYDVGADTHIILSWEGAEQFVRSAIEQKGSVKISETVEINDLFWGEKESDGRAAIIDFTQTDFSKFLACNT